MSCVAAAIFSNATSHSSCKDFTDRYEGRYRDMQLPLPMRLV